MARTRWTAVSLLSADCSIAGAYRRRRPEKKNVTLRQMILSSLPRDRLEMLIDEFLFAAGQTEGTLTKTARGANQPKQLSVLWLRVDGTRVVSSSAAKASALSMSPPLGISAALNRPRSRATASALQTEPYGRGKVRPR
jgi:hypothetical protein